MKDKAAVALGKKRWRKKTKAQKRAHMKMMSDRATAMRKIRPKKNFEETPEIA